MTQRMFCHACDSGFTVEADDDSWDGACPTCGDDFVEIVDNEDAQNDAQEPAQQQSRRRPNVVDPIGFLDRPQVININAMMPPDIRNIMEHVMGMIHESNPNFIDEISSRLMDEYQPATHPTATHVRESLPSLIVRKADAEGEPKIDEAFVKEGDPCTICHDDFVAGSKVIELPCTHCFHSDCLFPWLETHNTCPVCRIELPEENK